jgi:hypothetical protein
MTVNLIRSDSLYAGVPYAYAAIAATQRGDLVAAWEVVEAAFGDHDAPSTLLGVTVLGYPDQLVEIEAVAVAAS